MHFRIKEAFSRKTGDQLHQVQVFRNQEEPIGSRPGISDRRLDLSLFNLLMPLEPWKITEDSMILDAVSLYRSKHPFPKILSPFDLYFDLEVLFREKAREVYTSLLKRKESGQITDIENQFTTALEHSNEKFGLMSAFIDHFHRKEGHLLLLDIERVPISIPENTSTLNSDQYSIFWKDLLETFREIMSLSENNRTIIEEGVCFFTNELSKKLLQSVKILESNGKHKSDTVNKIVKILLHPRIIEELSHWSRADGTSSDTQQPLWLQWLKPVTRRVSLCFSVTNIEMALMDSEIHHIVELASNHRRSHPKDSEAYAEASDLMVTLFKNRSSRWIEFDLSRLTSQTLDDLKRLQDENNKTLFTENFMHILQKIRSLQKTHLIHSDSMRKTGCPQIDCNEKKHGIDLPRKQKTRAQPRL